MRLLIVALLLIVSRSFDIAIGIAGDPVTPDSSSLQRIRRAVSAGDSSSAVAAIRALPNAQRLEWLSELHQADSKTNPNGGGSITDYQSLIGLIENVIEGDWLGGGATMRPYPQGVRIDPRGLIERIDPNKQDLLTLKTPREQNKENASAKLSFDKLGEWQEPTPLRWVSLHQLDQQVAERTRGASVQRASIAMELLGGLYRIELPCFRQGNSGVVPWWASGQSCRQRFARDAQSRYGTTPSTAGRLALHRASCAPKKGGAWMHY